MRWGHVSSSQAENKLDFAESTGNAAEILQCIILADLEAKATGRPSAWPGETKAKTVKDYVTFLVDNRYLRESELKIFSAPGYPPADSLEKFSAENCAFTIFRVCRDDEPKTILITGKNLDLMKGWGPIETASLKEYFIYYNSGGGMVFPVKDFSFGLFRSSLPPQQPVALEP
jgi:hypothetical protein